jgi:hypothetical protein
MKNLLLLVLTLITVAGCTTPEFGQALYECEQDALKKYPKKLQNIWQRESNLVRVPDGNVSCSTSYVESGGTVGRPNYNAKTDCTQGERLEKRYYDVLVTVDENEATRSRYKYECAADLCTKRFGNRMCESSAVKSNQQTLMECQIDKDCTRGLSCRSKSGGGTVCR